jgi:Beta-lactamase enzyme family
MAVTATPPVLITPAPYEVSFGRIAGRISRDARMLLVGIDGRVVARRDLNRRSTFDVHIQLPQRRFRLTVTAVYDAQRRAGTTVRAVYGLPRAAEPRAPPRRSVQDPELAREIRALAQRFPGLCGIYVQNLRTGAGAAWNARAEFPAASTLKVAIAVEVLRALRGPPAEGSRLDVLMRKAIVPSDDKAANDLLTWLGGSTSGGSAKVNATFRFLGLHDTEMYGGYIVPAATPIPLERNAQPSFVGKRTTAWDFARLLRYLHEASAGKGRLARRGGFVPSEAKYLLYLLAHSQPSYLARYLDGTGVSVLDKPGWIKRARHDGGLAFWRDGSFVAVVLTYNERGVGVSSEILAGRVARAAYAVFSGAKAQSSAAGRDPQADPRGLFPAARGERAPQPRPSDVLHPGEAVVRDGAERPSWRRALRDVVRGGGRPPGDARQGGSGALLPAAVRGPPGLARRPPRRRAPLG